MLIIICLPIAICLHEFLLYCEYDPCQICHLQECYAEVGGFNEVAKYVFISCH
jgi:hypothetical protein